MLVVAPCRAAPRRAEQVDEEQVNGMISAVFMAFVGLSMPPLGGADDAGDDDGSSHRRWLVEAAAAVSSATRDDAHDDALHHGDDHGADDDHADGDGGDDDNLSAGAYVGHVIAVSALMLLGKMFPLCCYRDEAGWRTRLALSLGMCPRGEVGAGVIVISIGMGISGPAITIAVICLTINLVASSGFIMASDM